MYGVIRGAAWNRDRLPGEEFLQFAFRAERSNVRNEQRRGTGPCGSVCGNHGCAATYRAVHELRRGNMRMRH